MSMKTENYDHNLHHIGRPEDDSKRSTIPTVTVQDWVALYLQDALRDFASYEASDTEREIAWGYVEYIDMVVRGEDSKTVVIFAHDTQAMEVLYQAVWSYDAISFDAPRSKLLDEIQALLDAAT